MPLDCLNSNFVRLSRDGIIYNTASFARISVLFSVSVTREIALRHIGEEAPRAVANERVVLRPIALTDFSQALRTLPSAGENNQWVILHEGTPITLASIERDVASLDVFQSLKDKKKVERKEGKASKSIVSKWSFQEAVRRYFGFIAELENIRAAALPAANVAPMIVPIDSQNNNLSAVVTQTAPTEREIILDKNISILKTKINHFLNSGSDSDENSWMTRTEVEKFLSERSISYDVGAEFRRTEQNIFEAI